MLTKHDISELAKALRVSRPVEFKFAGAEADQGVFEGYVSVFGGIADSYGEIVEAGAFAGTLAEHNAEGVMPPLLWAHDPAEPVGRVLDLREHSRGLFVKAQFNLATERGREAFASVKAGDVSGLSFGYRVPPSGLRHNADGTLSLVKIDLLEISIVALPANRRARITGVKALASIAELERGLRGEIPLSLPRGAATKIAHGGWPALIEDDSPPTIDLDRLAERMDATVRALKSYG